MRKLPLTHTRHVSQGSRVPPDSQTHSCSLTLTVAFFLSFVYLFVGSSTEERGGKGKCLVLLLNISTVLSDDSWEVSELPSQNCWVTMILGCLLKGSHGLIFFFFSIYSLPQQVFPENLLWLTL